MSGSEVGPLPADRGSPRSIRATSAPADRWAECLLVGQAALVALWWVALAASPTVRGWFEMDGERNRVLTAFLAGDLVILLAGSLLAALALHRRWWWSQRLIAGVAGAVGYGTLYLAAWVALGGRGALGLAPMVAATVVCIALAAHRSPTSETP